ncbi:MAG: hypothetical protein AAF512_21550 [Pseudomonadota bacterium]
MDELPTNLISDIPWLVVIAVLFFFTILIPIFVKLRAVWLHAHRNDIIQNYEFPGRIKQKLQETYPHLSASDTEIVISGLKDYFQLCHLANKRLVAMPSQVVDVAWHEFILFTRQYEQFCKQALGRFLHHTPAEAMREPQKAQQGIRRAWRISCYLNEIDPEEPENLPLLFDIDRKLSIPDGFTYYANCKDKDGYVYCAGHIGCSTGCHGGSGRHDESSDNDSSSSCGGGGCGGD